MAERQIGDGGMNGGIRRALRSIVKVCAVAVAVAGSMTLIASAKATASPVGHATTHRVIVELTPGTDQAAVVDATKARGSRVGARFSRIFNGFSATVNDVELGRLEHDPLVRSVVPDVTFHVADTENPAPSWGLDRIDQRSLPLDTSYTYPSSGQNVTAYVVDTGVSPISDFGSRLLAGVDEVPVTDPGEDGVTSTTDCVGHGTFVADEIGGTEYGVAKGVSVVPVRVLDCYGSGQLSWILAGLQWIAQNATGPAVVNMSINAPSVYPMMNQAIASLVSEGITVVVAAGNASNAACGASPSGSPGAIAVGATAIATTGGVQSDTWASFSNDGPCVAISAPGVDITADSNAGTPTEDQGTSMSSPEVAGVAAMALAANPGLTPAGVRSCLVNDATQGTIQGLPPDTVNLLLYLPQNLSCAGVPTPAPPVELAWGYGPDGELGNGTTTSPRTTPVAVSLPPGVSATATAAASEIGYAIGSNGTLYAWGNGADGELGNGTENSTSTPVAVSLPSGVTPAAIAAGELTTYTLGSNGTVYAWGYGPDGELGNSTTTYAQTTPVAVSLPVGVTATVIGAAGYTGYAMGSNGTLYAWGNGADGELGNGTTTDPQTTPVAVSLPSGVTASAIAGGLYTGYALGSNGTVYAWGYGASGELGNNTTTSTQTTPVAVSLPSGVTATAIAAGELTGYALGSNGTVYAWGNGETGGLGNDTTNDPQTTPVAVSLPSGVTATAIAAARLTGYAIGSNGTLYSWGNSTYGQLGNGTTTFAQTTPVTVSLPAGVVATALGAGSPSSTGYAIARPVAGLVQGNPTGTTIDPGVGYSSQLSPSGVPLTGGGPLTWTTSTGSSEVTVSSSGAITVPTSVTTPGTVAINGTVRDTVGDSGTWSFTLTVVSPSDLLAWGHGSDGELGNDTTPTSQTTPVAVLLPTGVNATAIAGGSENGYALGSNGTVYAWGSNTDGQDDDGTNGEDGTLQAPIPVSLPVTATAIAAGDETGYALGSNGTVYAWGNGQGGELGNGTTPRDPVTPVAVSLPVTATAIAAGYALGSNGTVYTWGGGAATPVPVSLPVTATAIAAGYALGSNGTVYTLGGGAATPVPLPVTATVIAAGYQTSYALGSNGAVYAWGAGGEGELGNGTTTSTQTTPVAVSLPSGVTASSIATGTATAYAIGSNGTLYAWGSGADGQLGNSTTTAAQTTPVVVSLPAGVVPVALGPESLSLSGYAVVRPLTSPTITSAASTTFTQGQSGTFAVTATGTPAATFALSGAPSWLSIDPNTGVLAGTPPPGSGGIVTFTVDAGNGVSPDATQTFTLTVDEAPTITSANNTTFAEGMAGSFTVTAGGYPAPTFSQTGGLPNGVSINSAGVLSGTPTQSGSFPITVTATNGVSSDATQDFTLTVTPSGTAPIIASANQSTFTQGQPGTFTVSATGSPSPTFTESGTLPSGITLSSAGLLSGTTTQSGTFHFTIDAGNGVTPDATQSFTLTVTQLFQIWSSSLSNAMPGVAYGPLRLQAIGSSPGATLKWKKGGTLPKGIKLVGGVLEEHPASSWPTV